MRYKVVIKRAFDETFTIDANDEEEAYQKAVELFDDYEISGSEMYQEDTEITEL